MSACAPPFSVQGFTTIAGHISSYRCARNFDFVKLNFFFTFLPCRFITHILTAFSITFLTHFKKDGHTLFGLSSKVFTFDHLFTYIIKTLVNSLTMSLTEWPENQKNRCLSFSANSVGLHFRDRVEKIKENGKNTKIQNQEPITMGMPIIMGSWQNLLNWQEKYGEKKLAYTCTFGAKLQKYYNCFKF